jgi:hypothetical protein
MLYIGRRKVTQRSRSLGITLPSQFVIGAGLQPGDDLDIWMDGKGQGLFISLPTAKELFGAQILDERTGS